MNWKTIIILIVVLAIIVHFSGILDCKERFIKVDSSKCTPASLNTKIFTTITAFGEKKPDQADYNQKFVDLCKSSKGTPGQVNDLLTCKDAIGYIRSADGTCNYTMGLRKYLCSDSQENPARGAQTDKFNNNNDSQRIKCQKADGNWVAAGTGKRRCKNYLKKYLDTEKINNKTYSVCRTF